MQNLSHQTGITNDNNQSEIENECHVSIIIPVYNKVEFTSKCLASVIENTPAYFDYEILVVNNGSTDSTISVVESFIQRVSNIRLINLDTNLGFAKANNIAVQKAKGKYLILLNNDTEAQPGWLEHLVQTAIQDPSIGAVGSKLLFPDNTVQHAGVVICNRLNKEGTGELVATHRHYKADPLNPIVNIPQEYQVLTAACLLIPKNLFLRMDGFDERFWNGYEDVDLCLRISELGFKLVYCPKSVLIHYESQSGPERFSKVPENIQLLRSKWQEKVQYDFIIDSQNKFRATDNNQFMPYTNEVISIIIVTYNGLEYTRECFDSILATTKLKYEIIFIDNNSTDGTKDYLLKLKEKFSFVRFVLNEKNLGFPKGVNQGINLSIGSYILLINNDTLVTNGWLERMVFISKYSDKIGIVGPVSNSVSGVQVIKNANYKGTKGIHDFALQIKSEFFGEVMVFPRLAFLCTLIKREVIEKIGGLDERFSPGNYEDDDFCLRAQLAGYQAVIAKDVFIHHYGSKSFKADGTTKYAERLKINEKKFVDKWGTTPDDLWLRNKPIKEHSIIYPIDKNLINQSVLRARVHIQDAEYNLALIELETAYCNYSTNENDEAIIERCDLLNLLGNVSLIVGEFEKAQKYFEEELSLNPQSSSACAGLGDVFSASENFQSAKVMYEWAIKNDPKNQIANNLLVKVNTELGLEQFHNSLSEEV